MYKIMSPAEAVGIIKDGDCICVNSFVGIENPVDPAADRKPRMLRLCWFRHLITPFFLFSILLYHVFRPRQEKIGYF